MTPEQLRAAFESDEALDALLVATGEAPAAVGCGKPAGLIRPPSWLAEGQARGIDEAVKRGSRGACPLLPPEPDWLFAAPCPAQPFEGTRAEQNAPWLSEDGEGARAPLQTGAFLRTPARDIAPHALARRGNLPRTAERHAAPPRRRASDRLFRVFGASVAVAAAAVLWVHWSQDPRVLAGLGSQQQAVELKQPAAASPGSVVSAAGGQAVRLELASAFRGASAEPARAAQGPALAGTPLPTLRLEELPRALRASPTPSRKPATPPEPGRGEPAARPRTPQTPPRSPEAKLAEAPAVARHEPTLVPAAASRSHRQRPTVLELQAAVESRRHAARTCLTETPVSVRIRFQSSGQVSNIQALSGATVEETACLSRALRGLQVRPFAESSFALTTAFRPAATRKL